jgi:hypothetical protein
MINEYAIDLIRNFIFTYSKEKLISIYFVSTNMVGIDKIYRKYEFANNDCVYSVNNTEVETLSKEQAKEHILFQLRTQLDKITLNVRSADDKAVKIHANNNTIKMKKKEQFITINCCGDCERIFDAARTVFEIE